MPDFVRRADAQRTIRELHEAVRNSLPEEFRGFVRISSEDPDGEEFTIEVSPPPSVANTSARLQFWVYDEPDRGDWSLNLPAWVVKKLPPPEPHGDFDEWEEYLDFHVDMLSREQVIAYFCEACCEFLA